MEPTPKQWFVMRDLKRRNSNTLAINTLAEAGLEVFTPMTQMVMTIGRRRQKRDVPVIQDLLFVHETKAALDPYVEATPTLQYRYVKGRAADQPMTVRDSEMERFIFAVKAAPTTTFYRPGEITNAMSGKRVRIVGGMLDGYDGRLLSVRGMRKRRLIVELPGLISAAIEVEPDFIQITD